MGPINLYLLWSSFVPKNLEKPILCFVRFRSPIVSHRYYDLKLHRLHTHRLYQVVLKGWILYVAFDFMMGLRELFTFYCRGKERFTANILMESDISVYYYTGPLEKNS